MLYGFFFYFNVDIWRWISSDILLVKGLLFRFFDY